MKKKFLLACMLLIMTVCMVACGDKSDSSKEKEVRQEREKDEDDSDGESVLLGKLSELVGNEVPLAAIIPDEAVVEAVTEKTITVEDVIEETITVEESESVAVTSENAEFDVEIVNPVFFDKEGVTMTFLGFTEDHSEIRIQVDNNNPDNKRFDFRMNEVRINNIGYVTYGFERAENASMDEEGLAGTSIIYTVPTMLDYYQDFNNALQIAQEDRVIYAMVMELFVQIGSNSEEEELTVVLETSNYTEDYSNKCLAGCQKATVLTSSTDIAPSIQVNYRDYGSYDSLNYECEYAICENFNLYYKQVDDGIAVVFANGSNIEIMDYGYDYEYMDIAVVEGDNVILYEKENIWNYAMPKNGGMHAFKLEKTSTDIKRELEIANDMLISLMIVFPEYVDANTGSIFDNYYNKYVFLLLN